VEKRRGDGTGSGAAPIEAQPIGGTPDRGARGSPALSSQHGPLWDRARCAPRDRSDNPEFLDEQYPSRPSEKVRAAGPPDSQRPRRKSIAPKSSVSSPRCPAKANEKPADVNRRVHSQAARAQSRSRLARLFRPVCLTSLGAARTRSRNAKTSGLQIGTPPRYAERQIRRAVAPAAAAGVIRSLPGRSSICGSLGRSSREPCRARGR
jgi:hypothetical protein